MIVFTFSSWMTLLVLHHFRFLELLQSHGRHERGGCIRPAMSWHGVRWFFWIWWWSYKFWVTTLLDCPHWLSSCDLSLVQVCIERSQLFVWNIAIICNVLGCTIDHCEILDICVGWYSLFCLLCNIGDIVDVFSHAVHLWAHATRGTSSLSNINIHG